MQHFVHHIHTRHAVLEEKKIVIFGVVLTAILMFKIPLTVSKFSCSEDIIKAQIQ